MQLKMMQIANIIFEASFLLEYVEPLIPAITPNMPFLPMLLSIQTGLKVILPVMDKQFYDDKGIGNVNPDYLLSNHFFLTHKQWDI